MSGFFDSDMTPKAPPPSYQQDRSSGQGDRPSYPNQQGGQGGGQREYGDRQGYNNNRGNGGNGGGGGGGRKFDPPPEEPGYVYMPYVVTGNDRPPSEIIERLGRIVKKLGEMGYVLRVGGHTDVEKGVEQYLGNGKVEVHLPFRDFDNRKSKFTYTSTFITDVAKMFHTSWDGLSKGVRLFLGKNIRLIGGKDGRSRAMFLLVWSDDGAEHTKDVTTRTGNAGHIITAATAYRIPVINMANRDAEERLAKLLGN